ncbi:MAG: hypothetical protein PVF43_05285 [Candidatus Eiseniibacteriota bacterium]
MIRACRPAGRRARPRVAGGGAGSPRITGVVVASLASVLFAVAPLDGPPVAAAQRLHPGPAFDEPGASTLAAILARWNERLADTGELDEATRQREVNRFMATVPWADLVWLCCEGRDTVPADSVGILQSMVRYRIAAGEPSPALVAATLADPGCLWPCKWEFLDWEHGAVEQLDGEARRALALAGLAADAADSTLPIQTRRRLLTGAAQLTAADTLMTFMMRAARAGEDAPDDALLAVRMLGSSRDPRAPDSLAALLGEFHAAGSSLVDAALSQCREACARRAGPVLIDVYREAGTPRRHRQALMAVARVPSVEAVRELLGAYDDGGTVVDSTWTLTGDAYQRHYDLWLASRIAEPHLVAWLISGTPEEASLALELTDRMLRFGPPIDGDGLRSALDRWIERAAHMASGDGRGPDLERSRAVRRRAVSPPPVPGTH